jgi:hypothetical protein
VDEWADNPPIEEEPLDEGCLWYGRFTVACVCQCDHVVIMHSWFRPDQDVLATAAEALCPWCFAKAQLPGRAEAIDALDRGHTEFLGGPAVIVRTGMTSAEYVQFQLWEVDVADGEAE